MIVYHYSCGHNHETVLNKILTCLDPRCVCVEEYDGINNVWNTREIDGQLKNGRKQFRKYQETNVFQNVL